MCRVTTVILVLILICSINGQKVDPSKIKVLTDPSGIITSPGYDGKTNYPGDQEQHWLIASRYSYNIKITFNDFDLDDSPGCQGDHVIFEIDPRTETQLKAVCGRNKPRDVVYQSNRLLITFFSDFIGSGRGFNISYEFTNDVDTCTSSNMYPCGNRKCVSRRVLCDGTDDCGDGTDESKVYCRRRMMNRAAGSCGKPAIKPRVSEKLVHRIVGGSIAKQGSWPWMADFTMKMVEPSAHTCGGALIHPQYVLSATHCVAGLPYPQLYKFILGNHYLFNETSVEQTRYVESFVAYPDLTPRRMANDPGNFDITHDMVLLKLNAPVVMTDHVSTVCLPKNSNQKLAVGTKCYLTGWGETRGSGDSSILKQLMVTIRDLSECEVSHNVEGGPKLNRETMICLKPDDHGNGACAGDSGGPLVCSDNVENPEDGTWTIHGVASFVTDSNSLKPVCGSNETAVVYNSVAAKLGWLGKAFQFLESN